MKYSLNSILIALVVFLVASCKKADDFVDFKVEEEQFSGLIAHLIAHIDKSHVTKRLFFEFGINNFRSIANSSDDDALLSVLNVLNPSVESFSHPLANESEADTHAVSLLAESDQSCVPVGLFIQQMQKLPPAKQSIYLDIHSGVKERIEDINTIASSKGCDVTIDSESSTRFKTFLNSLP